MRRSLYTSVLIVLYLLLTAKSCDSRQEADQAREQAALAAAKDSIRTAAAPDTLTGSSLQAFERVAVIKMSDFGDFLAILRDTAVDPAFKEKARDMIRSMFVSDNSSLHFPCPGNSRRKDVVLQDLLTPEAVTSCGFGKVIADSTRVWQSLQRSGGPDYLGVLSYAFILASTGPGNDAGQALIHGTVGFVVTRNPKVFGADTLMVWEVLLGNRE